MKYRLLKEAALQRLIEEDIPNIDDMSPDEVDALYAKYKKGVTSRGTHRGTSFLSRDRFPEYYKARIEGGELGKKWQDLYSKEKGMWDANGGRPENNAEYEAICAEIAELRKRMAELEQKRRELWPDEGQFMY